MAAAAPTAGGAAPAAAAEKEEEKKEEEKVRSSSFTARHGCNELTRFAMVCRRNPTTTWASVCSIKWERDQGVLIASIAVFVVALHRAVFYGDEYEPDMRDTTFKDDERGGDGTLAGDKGRVRNRRDASDAVWLTGRIRYRVVRR